jgi:hypothetical protein
LFICYTNSTRRPNNGTREKESDGVGIATGARADGRTRRAEKTGLHGRFQRGRAPPCRVAARRGVRCVARAPAGDAPRRREPGDEHHQPGHDHRDTDDQSGHDDRQYHRQECRPCGIRRAGCTCAGERTDRERRARITHGTEHHDRRRTRRAAGHAHHSDDGRGSQPARDPARVCDYAPGTSRGETGGNGTGGADTQLHHSRCGDTS